MTLGVVMMEHPFVRNVWSHANAPFCESFRTKNASNFIIGKGYLLRTKNASNFSVGKGHLLRTKNTSNLIIGKGHLLRT